MSKYFTSYEIKSLIDIRERICSGHGLSSVMEACENAGNFKDNFPILYAAVLSATHGRNPDALSIHSTKKLKNYFTDEFFRYLKENKTVEPKVVVFKSSLPYDAWVKTNLFKIELENTLNTASSFFRTTPQLNDFMNVLDIGPGNGRMTARIVNRIIAERKTKKVNLVLLDKFPAMLDAAKVFCKETIKAETFVQTICCPAQELNDDILDILRGYTPFNTTICSRSIHHMTSDLKSKLLRKLNNLTESIILVEMNSTHDLPEKDEPDLVYSIVKSYGFIFNDIRKSHLTEEEKLAAIDDFLLAEALFVLGKNKAERIDYHATIEEWRELAVNAGFKVTHMEPSALYPDGEPHYFTMIMSNK